MFLGRSAPTNTTTTNPVRPLDSMQPVPHLCEWRGRLVTNYKRFRKVWGALGPPASLNATSNDLSRIDLSMGEHALSAALSSESRRGGIIWVPANSNEAS